MTHPDPSLAKLQLMLGRWEGEEHLSATPSQPTGVASGRHSVRLALNGTAVIQDYVQLRAGQPDRARHGVFTLDPANGEVLWYLFDSNWGPPLAPARGGWQGDHLQLAGPTAAGEARYRLRFGADWFDSSVETRLTGASAFSTVLTARYTRSP